MRKNDYPATIGDLKRAAELYPQWVAVQKTLQAVEAEAAEIEQKLGKGALESFAKPEQNADAEAETESKPLQHLPQPGSVVVDCVGCPVLVVIPYDLSGLIPPIAVGKFELTVAQWNMCIDEGGCSHRPAGSEAERGSFPVADVSWEDAHTYLDWLSQKSGHPYRLLREGEWEYAARAGSSTMRYWGDSPEEGCEFANGADLMLLHKGRDTTVSGCRDGQMKAAPAGKYKPNGYGLYDTLGNVAEWMDGCADSGPVESVADENADGVADCSHHAARGGSWKSRPEHMHAEARIFLRPGVRTDTVGFRVVRDLSSPPMEEERAEEDAEVVSS